MDNRPLKVVGFFQFIVCRKTVVLGGVMRRFEVPLLLIILDLNMLDKQKERTDYSDD